MNFSATRRAVVLLGALSLAPWAAWADTLPDAAAVARYAQGLLDEQGIDPKGPGLTLLVARGDTLLATAARGQASIELGVPLAPDHVMRLGSITKQFAAATLLRLVDEGKASLDDPLSKYLPDYPNGQAITLTQLLNHTSGIKSYTGIGGYMHNPIRHDLSTQELVAVFKDQPADFAPGARWAYNNSGYVLVGAVIEAITGKSWHEALQSNWLQPNRVAVSYPAPDRLIPGHVAGYTRSGNGWAPAGLVSMTQPHAAGALVGNVESLWRWNQALHEKGLLKPSTYQRMVTPQGPAEASRYGFGIGTDRIRGMAALQHGGGIHGFGTVLYYLPAQRITVALLRNSDRATPELDPLARRLSAFAAGKAYPAAVPVAVPPATLKAFEGVYSQGAVTRTLRVVDGKLVSQRAGGSTVPLTPLGQDRFAVGTGLAQLQFQRNAAGAVTGQVYYPDGDDQGPVEPLPRTGDLPQRPDLALSEAQRQALVGQYVGERLSFSVFVDPQGVLRGQVPGQPAVTLKASAPRELYVVEVDASLSFGPAEGEVQTVVLKQGPGRFELKRQR
ncbi:serine hydrolase domain-containing protein [Inhella crocodyli]|uniref:Class A beta-lactamase-related serine hydrolase n=1 Tax=Inhella crocodyli TaxID=2499851 RepID=A0A437LR30_9BURK|nr:serine hydrolase domain-containing protein [Inhella crocodyli]RVT87870.1 class A beta-lactamase-related serine hydrolase [Inhella crocodyli]